MIHKAMRLNFLLMRGLGSLVMFLVLSSCSEKDDLQSREAWLESGIGIHLTLEGGEGSPISVNQDFLRDFRVTDLGGVLPTKLSQRNGQVYLDIEAWAYPKKDIRLHDGDTITSNLRIYKGKSCINVTCYYEWTNLAERSGKEELMYGGTGFILVRLSYNGKNYELKENGGILLPLIWSQGKLQVK